MLEMQLKAAAGVPDSDSGDCLLYTANHARVSCGLWGLLGMQLLRSGLNQAVIKIRVMTGIRVSRFNQFLNMDQKLTLAGLDTVRPRVYGVCS